MKKLWAIIISFALLTISISTLVFYRPLISENIEEIPCYVGVAFGGNTTTEAKLVIDRIKEYSNLFILQSGPISTNETATNEICDYAVASGLDIIVYFGDLAPRILSEKNLTWRASWVLSLIHI